MNPSEFSENVVDEKSKNEIILATRASRLAAKILDLFFFLSIIVIGLMLASFFGEMNFRDLYFWLIELQTNDRVSVNIINNSPEGFQILLIVLSFFSVIIIQSRLLIRDGQTIGKKIIGIKIINAFNLGKVKLINIIFIRWIFFEILSFLPFGTIIVLADVVFIFRKDRRCLHDMLSGTVVSQKIENIS
ncbi:MAG: hypothetical protein CL764_04355 [Chloroflexi bacterium]|nr:hypothetical protein [Chloroflexota bacterium]|tara:strand:- start:4590 stop:5156 length:567 start_codon:yes stop_codon:yes gene_type:complete